MVTLETATGPRAPAELGALTFPLHPPLALKLIFTAFELPAMVNFGENVPAPVILHPMVPVAAGLAAPATPVFTTPNIVADSTATADTASNVRFMVLPFDRMEQPRKEDRPSGQSYGANRPPMERMSSHSAL